MGGKIIASGKDLNPVLQETLRHYASELDKTKEQLLDEIRQRESNLALLAEDAAPLLGSQREPQEYFSKQEVKKVHSFDSRQPDSEGEGVL